jgi:hypothetical protein
MGLCEAFIRNLRAIGVAFDLLGEKPPRANNGENYNRSKFLNSLSPPN